MWNVNQWMYLGMIVFVQVGNGSSCPADNAMQCWQGLGQSRGVYFVFVILSLVLRSMMQVRGAMALLVSTPCNFVIFDIDIDIHIESLYDSKWSDPMSHLAFVFVYSKI